MVTLTGNTTGRTRAEAEANIRRRAKGFGDTVTKINSLKKKGAARVKGKQVWTYSAQTRQRKQKKKKR